MKHQSQPNSLYFANFPIDFFFLCGISFLIYGWAWYRGNTEVSNETRQLTSLLAWFINWPHFSATSYRLYSDANHRRQFPLTTYLVPVILVGLFALGLQNPEVYGVGFVKLYFLWSAMHFSAQSFGITQLYISRSGNSVNPWSRRLIWSSIYFSFLYTFVAAQVGPTPIEYFGLKIPSFQFPEILRQILWWSYVGLMAGFFAWFALQKMRVKNFPWMVLWIPITQFIWYSVFYVAFFNEFVPMLHCLQYLFLAYFVEAKERGGVQNPLRLFWVSSRWYGLNVLGGAVLFYYLPMIGPAIGYANAGIFTAMTWALVQIHHFFVDGVIWRLRYSVSRSPLFTSWKDVRGKGDSKNLLSTDASPKLCSN